MRGGSLLGALSRAARQSAGASQARGFAAQPAAEEAPALRNAAAILHGIDDLRWGEHPDFPEHPPRGHVRVRMRAVGICGSDIHYWKHGRIGDFVVKEPMVIGHESAGDVVAHGEGTEGLVALGTRVALEPGVPCWGSTVAREGRYNICPEVKYFATPPVHGSLCKFVDHPADFCFPLPANMSYEEAAVVEPLSNGIHACKRARVGPGKSVAILGAGPMGLNALAAAAAFGATQIAITDISENNLPLAEQLGAKWPLLTPPGMRPREAADLIRGCLGPAGADCVIDCAGFQSTVQTGMDALKRGGSYVLVGMGSDCCDGFPMMTLVTKEADVRGCFRYTNTYPAALELVSEGRIDVERMISHRFACDGLDSVLAGFRCAADAARTKAIKVMFHLPASD